MKRAILLPLVLLATFCATGTRGPVSQPGRGALAIEVIPNPIVATSAGGDAYDFPFEVVVRETGGRPVRIEHVTANVLAFGSISVGSEAYDRARIEGLGFSTLVPANGELRYRFTLFGSVTAELRVDGRDDNGATVVTRTTIGVTTK